MYHFHASIHARPDDCQPAAPLAVAGQRLTTLQISPEWLGKGALGRSFEEAAADLARLERMFIEPDGSFVWVSRQGEAAWQIDGNLLDHQERLRWSTSREAARRSDSTSCWQRSAGRARRWFFSWSARRFFWKKPNSAAGQRSIGSNVAADCPNRGSAGARGFCSQTRGKMGAVCGDCRLGSGRGGRSLTAPSGGCRVASFFGAMDRETLAGGMPMGTANPAAAANAQVARTGRLAGPADFVVKPVETRRERKAFLELPWQIYRDDPNWMPPLRMNQKELVGYARHPFYDDAKGQTFLALQGGKAIGRIEAIENPVHNRFHQERRGFFGFFEAIDNQAVANALFDAARDWLAARDIHQIRGPVNPSLNYECGLLVEGFHLPPSFMMTYNPPYYPRLIENYGFRKAQDLYAFWARTAIIPNLDEKLLFIAQEAASRLGVHMRPLDKSRFRQEIEMFLDLYNQSLGGTWGFVPLSKREIDHMAPRSST